MLCGNKLTRLLFTPTALYVLWALALSVSCVSTVLLSSRFRATLNKDRKAKTLAGKLENVVAEPMPRSVLLGILSSTLYALVATVKLSNINQRMIGVDPAMTVFLFLAMGMFWTFR